MKFWNKNLRLLVPVALCAVSLFFMIAGSDEPVIGMVEGTFLESWLHKMHIGNSIVFGIGTGTFSGLVVWFFAVHIPEQNKRRILRNNLSDRYRLFKKNVLAIFFSALHRHRSSENLPQPEYLQQEELLDYRKFREFFDRNNSEYTYDVSNGLYDEDLLQEILQQMALLSQEAMHVRNRCGIQDKRIHDFLGRMSEISLDFKRTNPHCDYDYHKSLMRFLWSIFTQWDFVEGQHEKDPIQTMIDEI